MTTTASGGNSVTYDNGDRAIALIEQLSARKMFVDYISVGDVNIKLMQVPGVAHVTSRDSIDPYEQVLGADIIARMRDAANVKDEDEDNGLV
jgi:hypothetical protein